MLPVRKVVLFKHGVGYFERSGEVGPEAAVDLLFKASEMNDVLKSLTVLDLGGGIVSSISYESTKPIEKQLEDIAIRIPDDGSLSGLLAQVKGARVEVEAGSRKVAGAVAGVETVARRADGETVWTRYLTLMVDGASVETFDLLELRRLTFLDEPLRKDLQHLLDTLISAKKKDLKRLTIFGRGENARTLVASYIVEAPVWKTSYRILLSGEEPLVQGWALVDNTGDEDWVDVELTLVSGLPVSFVHDLYSPRYKRRPVVEVREEEAYAPPVLEEATSHDMDEEMFGLADVRTQAGVAGFSARPGVPVPRSPAPRMLAKAPPPVPRAAAVSKTLAVQTRNVEVGDLFQYSIENAVTVKRNQSALVPILQRRFEGRRVAVYNPEVRERNPLSAVLFQNTTGMTLEAGPVTVLEGEAYLGESMLETLKPGEERLVPFSVELGCLVTADSESRVEDVHQAKLVGGTLSVRRYRIERTVYLLKNKLDRDLDLYLEHRIDPERSLVDTPEPVARTESYYRFRLAAKAGVTTRFEVKQKGDVHESWSVTSVDQGTVAAWLKRKYIDQPTREALDRLVDINEKAASLAYWIRDREQTVEGIFQNQERLRQNLSSLGSSQDERGLRERYVAALNEEEDRLAALRAEIQGWKEEKARLEAEAQSLVAGLRFESGA